MQADELPARGAADGTGPLSILRPEDLLVVTVHLTNLEVSPDRTLLRRVDAGQPACLTFELPSQHQSEQTFLEWDNGSEPAAPAPIRVLGAAPSRLAFELAPDQDTWPLDIASLLDWSGLVPRLAGNALPPDAVSGPGPEAPAPDRTALELPYRLVLSPDRFATWTHRTEPFGVAGRTELWHTRMGYPPTGDRRMPLRAIFHRDLGNSFAASLTRRDLDDLVTLTGDFSNQPQPAGESGLPAALWLALMRRAGLLGAPIVPVPLRADRVLLGPLGASVRMQGHFTFPSETQDPEALAMLGVKTPSLLQYEHVMGSGRDQWVKVVRRGYVDTGQRACLVKTTHRTFEPQQVGTEQGPDGAVGIFGTKAYLRQYYQVVILQPGIDFAELAGGYRHGGREMPLRSLQLTTLTTPKLDLPLGDQTPETLAARHRLIWPRRHPGVPIDPVEIDRAVQADIEAATDQPFWVRAAGTAVPFGFTAKDWEGRDLTGSMPLMFIPYTYAVSAGAGAKVAAAYEAGGARRTVSFGGQVLALADPAGSAPGSTASPAESVTFGMQALTSHQGLPASYRPPWLWAATGFSVHLEAAQRLTGSAGPAAVTWDPAYLTQGLDPATNPAGRFARLTNQQVVAFSGSRGGGLARPRSPLDLLTSRQGLVPEQLAGGAVDLTALKALLGGATLFGTIPLSSILAEIPAPSADVFALADLPEDELADLLGDPARLLPLPVLRSRRVPDASGRPVAVEARFVWKPELRTQSGLAPLIDVGGAQFVLDVRSITPLAAGGEETTGPETTVHGELTGFSLTFGGVVKVSFGKLAFTVLPGRKPDVTAEGVGLDFLGPLEFVNTLRDIIPAAGFSDPPAVSVTPEGITAGYSLAVPTVGVGIFSLQNLSLSAELALPFVGKPAGLRFAVSEREHPFLVSVTMFGGGGFFALSVSANGVEEVEAAIEFGGNVSLNLGVASGGVSVMAGVYFGLKPSGCTLTGFLRCGGYLSVLGLISISVEFYLAFTWRRKDDGGSEVWGQAALTVKVKVACFSKSVTLSVERRFAGASGDPTLEDVVSSEDWQDYCLAFAPEVAP